jgi:hypothetical protein
MYNQRTYPSDHGVSEALGFMLIFSMVIIGIGLVTLYGYPMLIQQQTNADEQIMQKNMIVLQNDVKMVTYKTVPYKETALKIGSGSLTSYNPLADPAAPKWNIYNEDSIEYVTDYTSGDLRYESYSTQTDVSLQNGAVVAKKRVEGGSFMLAEPRWFYDDRTNTMVISLIALNNTETLSRTGIGTVQMIYAPNSTTMRTYRIPAGTDVYVNYDPGTPVPGTATQDYSIAWNNYFKNTVKMIDAGSCLMHSTPTAKCYIVPFKNDPVNFPWNNLVIKKYEVTIKSL